MPMPLSATVKVSRTRPRPTLADRAEKPMRPRSVNFTALSIRFSSALRSRTSSPRRRSGQSPAMSISVSSALRLGAGDQRCRYRLGQPARRERLFPQHDAARIRLGGVDHQGGELRQMIAGAADRIGPAALALWKVGRGEQFRQRQDAVQRGADVVGQPRQRHLDDVRTTRRRTAPLARAFPALGFGHASPRPRLCRGYYIGSPKIRRISAGVTPCARSSRSPVDRVDFDSFLPSASRISR